MTTKLNTRLTPFEEKRLGRVILSEAFVTSFRSRDVFEKFSILQAQPRYNETGMLVYYGAHPDFKPYDGKPGDAPYYQAYWDKDGMYFKEEK